MMRRFLGVTAFAVACAGVVVSAPVGAQAPSGLDIPLETVVRGDAGSEHLLIPAEHQGKECIATVGGANNESVHPDTNLIVRSGESTVELLDIDREPGAITEGTGPLTLGTEVTVSVVLGEDGVFSGGTVLSIECPMPEEPTTTTTTTPPTSAPPEATPPAPPAQPVPGQPSFVG